MWFVIPPTLKRTFPSCSNAATAFCSSFAAMTVFPNETMSFPHRQSVWRGRFIAAGYLFLNPAKKDRSAPMNALMDCQSSPTTLITQFGFRPTTPCVSSSNAAEKSWYSSTNKYCSAPFSRVKRGKSAFPFMISPAFRNPASPSNALILARCASYASTTRPRWAVIALLFAALGVPRRAR